MLTTRLSSKGQVIIPKEIRATCHWSPGLELEVIDTEDGILLKPLAPFQASSLEDVAGCLRREGKARLSQEEITRAIRRGVRQAWRDRR